MKRDVEADNLLKRIADAFERIASFVCDDDFGESSEPSWRPSAGPNARPAIGLCKRCAAREGVEWDETNVVNGYCQHDSEAQPPVPYQVLKLNTSLKPKQGKIMTLCREHLDEENKQRTDENALVWSSLFSSEGVCDRCFDKNKRRVMKFSEGVIL